MASIGPLGERGAYLGGEERRVERPDGTRLAVTAWPAPDPRPDPSRPGAGGGARGGAGGPRLPAIVLLHGLGQQRRFWGPVARRLLAVPGRGPVVAFDQRGHGDTGAAPSGSYRVDACADDVAGVLGALGWEPAAVVVGHSWGASVALAAAARHGDRLAAAVAIDGGVAGPGDLGPRAEVRALLTPPRLALPLDRLVGLLRAGALGPWWAPEVEAALLPTFEEGDDGLVRTRIGVERHLQVLDGMLDHDHEATLAALGCPAWIVTCEPLPDHLTLAGGLDAHAGPPWREVKARGLARAAELLARPRLLRWEGAIHDVPLQWPALVAGVILAAAEEAAAGAAGAAAGAGESAAGAAAAPAAGLGERDRGAVRSRQGEPVDGGGA